MPCHQCLTQLQLDGKCYNIVVTLSQNSSKEVAEFLEVDRIEFSLTNETVESLEKLSQTEKREVINVDGDPFVLLHPDVHIK